MARALALLALGGGKDAWRQIVGKGEADSTYSQLDLDGSFHVVAPSSGATRGDWAVKVLSGEVEEHRDGDEFRSPSPDLATASRYFIALPDLLVDGGSAFGRQIHEQASGGIRWTELSQGLGWAEAPARPLALRNQVASARSAYSKAVADQVELEKRTSRLPALREERRALGQRELRAEPLKEAQKGRKLRSKLNHLGLELAQFDARLAGFAGTEPSKLEQLSKDVETANKNFVDCRTDIEVLERSAPAPLSERERLAQLDLIEGLVRALESRHAEATDAATECAGAVGRLREAAEQLAALDAAMPQMDPADVPLNSILDAGTEVSRAAWDSNARSSVADELRRHVVALEARWGLDQASVAPSVEDAGEALGLLSQWLRQPRAANAPATAPAPRTLVVALILVGLSIMAALIDAMGGSISGLANTVLGLVVVVLLWPLCFRPRIAPTTAPEPDGRREEYERLARVARGIPLPAEWVVDQVQALHAQLSKCVVTGERQRLLRELRSALKQLDESAETEGKKLAEAMDSFGKLAALSSGKVDLVWASVLARLCVGWLEAKRLFAASEAKLRSAQERVKGAAASVGEALIDAGCIDRRAAETLGAESARELLTSMRERIEKRLSYERLQHGPESDRERRLLVRVREAEESLRRFLSEAPGGPFTKESLEGLCAQWGRYQAAKQAWSMQDEAQREHAAEFPEPEHIRQMSDEDVATEIDAIPALREQADALVREITGLEKEIEVARDGKVLSNALSSLAAANLELRQREIADLDTVIGQAVLEWARREAKTSMQPRVLSRARRLAAQFTAGSLDFDVDGSEGREGDEFRARNGSEPWRPISRLSSGERVQLLLSVRLAFLEESESVRLPIILDEVLASSDDDRAARVMDAVVDVAKSGRQVLYLSSQADEIEKWTARLEGSGVSFRVVRLAEIRGMEAAQSRPARQPLPPERTWPDPDACTRAEYAERISVPGIDWLDDRLDSLHLWYVLPGPSDLHRQLIAGIETLGQLERLAEVAGSASAQQALEQSLPRVSGFRAAASALGVGRGKPLGPEVLDDCDAITNAFRTRVGECLGASGGDARGFLGRVGSLKGFREANRSRLEEWLTAGGYLVDGARMAPSEIRDAVDVAVRASGIPETEVPGIVDEVMAQLPM